MQKRFYLSTIALFIFYLLIRILSFYFITELAKVLDDRMLIYTKTIIIYGFLTDFLSLGIFPAISNLVSKEESIAKIKYIARDALKYLFIIGITGFFIFQTIANVFYFNDPMWWYLEIISVGLIYHPILIFLRGLNQGLLKPFRVLISIVIEALIKILFIYISMNSIREKYQLYIVFIGIVLSTLISFIYLYRLRPKGEEEIYDYKKNFFLKAISLLPITMVMSFFSIIDLFTYKILSIPKSTLQSVYFNAFRLINMVVFIVSIFSSLYLPYLNKRNKPYSFFRVNAIVFIFFLIFNLISSRLYLFVYQREADLFFKSMIYLALLIALLKLYLPIIIRHNNLIMTILFSTVIVLKLIINIIVSRFGSPSATIESTYICLIIIIIGMLIYFLATRKIRYLDLIKVISFILSIAYIYLFLTNVLALSLHPYSLDGNLLITIALSPIPYLILKN